MDMADIVKNSIVNMPIEPYALRPTSDSVNIRWMSATPCLGEVEYWMSGRLGSKKVIHKLTENIPTCFHDMRLQGLESFNQYSYRVLPEGKEYQFKTASVSENDKFTFVVFGDPQGHAHLRETMELAKSFNPDFALGLGDFVGGANDNAYIQYFERSRLLLDGVPLYPTPGNHDYRRHTRPFDHDNDLVVYDRHLGNGDGDNYFFDYGKFRFIMLNYPDADTIKRDSASGRWLIEQLTTARTLGGKIFLSHHCPCFTSTEITWAVDDSFIPPLSKEFADVVLIDFGAHIHTYERSRYPDDSGVFFITTGGAGELYDFPVNKRENIYQRAAVDACHVCVVDVEPSIACVRAVGIDDKVLDCFELDLNPA